MGRNTRLGDWVLPVAELIGAGLLDEDSDTTDGTAYVQVNGVFPEQLVSEVEVENGEVKLFDLGGSIFHKGFHRYLTREERNRLEKSFEYTVERNNPTVARLMKSGDMATFEARRALTIDSHNTRKLYTLLRFLIRGLGNKIHYDNRRPYWLFGRIPFLTDEVTKAKINLGNVGGNEHEHSTETVVRRLFSSFGLEETLANVRRHGTSKFT